MSFHTPIQNQQSRAPRAARSQLRCDLPAELPVLAEEIELLSAWLGEALDDITNGRLPTSGYENQ